LAENDNMKLLILEGELTVSKAMNSLSLRKLEKSIDKINIVKSITYLVLRLSDNFNVKQKFTEEQASIMALDLSEIFAYETLEDVVLMFKLARQGKIGGTEYKLDGQTVMQKWVPQYLELKSIERESHHNKSKGEKNGMNSFNWSKESFDKMEVSEKLTLPSKLGQRAKENLEVPSDYKAPIVDRKTFLDNMFISIKNQSTESLKDYLLNVDCESPKFDAELYEMVEKEMDLR